MANRGISTTHFCIRLCPQLEVAKGSEHRAWWGHQLHAHPMKGVNKLNGDSNLINIFTLDKYGEMSPPPLFSFSQLPRFKSTFLFLKESHYFSMLFRSLLLLFYPLFLFHSGQEIIIFTKLTHCPLLLTLQAFLQLLHLCPFSVRIIIKTLYVTAESNTSWYKATAYLHEIHN